MNHHLLEEAKEAEERVIEAEHEAEVARATFNRSIRRLHLHGGSLREIAAELGISHQRVHQIVEAAGGGRRWRQPPSSGQDACSFCGAPRNDERRFLLGPAVVVCNACLRLAATAIEGGDAGGPHVGGVQLLAEEDARTRCNFCGKRKSQVGALAGPDDPAAPVICDECTTVGREIVGDLDEGESPLFRRS